MDWNRENGNRFFGIHWINYASSAQNSMKNIIVET